MPLTTLVSEREPQATFLAAPPPSLALPPAHSHSPVLQPSEATRVLARRRTHSIASPEGGRARPPEPGWADPYLSCFRIPLWGGVLITIVDTFFFLFLDNYGGCAPHLRGDCTAGWAVHAGILGKGSEPCSPTLAEWPGVSYSDFCFFIYNMGEIIAQTSQSCGEDSRR